MTSEELAFTQALDAEPKNHWLRCVFADWLDDRGDPRGPGMRALGRLELRSIFTGWNQTVDADVWLLGRDDNCKYEDCLGGFLPVPWWEALEVQQIGNFKWWRYYASRAAAEDAAALAWAKLTPEQQARILADAGVLV